MQELGSYFIEISSLNIQHQGFSIFQDANLRIERGAWVYLLGATGSGKTTLLKALWGQQPIQAGSIRIDQHQVEKLDATVRPFFRRQLGIISLDFPLLNHLNVFDNLDFVLQATDWLDLEQRHARIQQVFQLLNLQKIAQRQISQLSKLDYVRTLIARALLNRPPLLLIDEPTSMLDEEASEDILSFLYNFAKASNTTVIFATVNPNIPELFRGTVYQCEGGRLQEVRTSQ